MNILVLIGGGRSGIDLFQSLLDGHPQIIQFPGVFYFDEFLKKIDDHKNSKEKILKVFIESNKHFFNSKLNKRERHHKLGDKRNKFFTVSIKKFRYHFLKLFEEIKINNFKNKILFALHLAYCKACKKKVTLKKCLLVLHLHHVYRLTCMEGLNFKILYTIRHPFASISSLVNHWFRFDKKKRISSDWFYFQLDRLFYGIKKCQFYAPTIVVKLESVHVNNLNVMKKFCKLFNLKFNTCLTKSTYHNLKWWGDKVSTNYLNGINKKFKNKIDLNLFFKNDLYVLSTKFHNLMKKYKYDQIFSSKSFNGISYFPLKIELMILKNILSDFNLKELIKFIYYFFKRIILFNNNSFNKKQFKTILI